MSRGRSSAAHKLDDAAPIFAALGDATRVRLVARLSADGPLSISRLSEGSGVTRQAVTKHLRAMGDAGPGASQPSRPRADFRARAAPDREGPPLPRHDLGRLGCCDRTAQGVRRG